MQMIPWCFLAIKRCNFDYCITSHTVCYMQKYIFIYWEITTPQSYRILWAETETLKPRISCWNTLTPPFLSCSGFYGTPKTKVYTATAKSDPDTAKAYVWAQVAWRRLHTPKDAARRGVLTPQTPLRLWIVRTVPTLSWLPELVYCKLTVTVCFCPVGIFASWNLGYNHRLGDCVISAFYCLNKVCISWQTPLFFTWCTHSYTFCRFLIYQQ